MNESESRRRVRFEGAEAIARSYRLPLPWTREMIAECVRQSLLTRWQAWCCVAVTAAAWTAAWQSDWSSFSRFSLLLAAGVVWLGVGRWLALPAIHAAARAKADRLMAIDKGTGGPSLQHTIGSARVA
jgi:hypothetical protein